MPTYIALLRGINVSGHNKIKMVELKQLFIEIGFSKVETYIQSGNVIFFSEEINTEVIETQISNKIKIQFDYCVSTFVITKNELNQIYNSNPFILAQNLETKKQCVTFLKHTPTKDDINKVQLLASAEEEAIFVENIAYLYCPNGFGRTKLSNNNIEKKLNTSATSRNWNTISKLINLSN